MLSLGSKTRPLAFRRSRRHRDAHAGRPWQTERKATAYRPPTW
jgi:hypothetical protein